MWRVRAQEAVNLARVRAVLERALPDVPRQREEAQERQAAIDALKDYFTVRHGAHTLPPSGQAACFGAGHTLQDRCAKLLVPG